jgi:hypothetical protein
MTPHLRRCQGFAVVHYGFTLDALNLGHPRLSLNQGVTILSLSFLSKGQHANEHRPQDWMRKMSRGIDFLFIIKYFFHLFYPN